MSRERLSPLKVIFLDIDGVLNTTRAHLAFGSSQWDPTGVALLARICKETGAKLVISSVWRGSMEKWMHAHQLLDAVGLGKHGLCAGHLGLDWGDPDYDSDMLHRTPPGHDNPRGEKIQEWLDKWKPDNYAILDDDIDMLSSQASHFVKVNGRDGIGYGTYNRMIAILGKKEDDENAFNEDQMIIPLPVPEGANENHERRSEGVWKATLEVELTGINALDQDHAEHLAQDILIEKFMNREYKYLPKAVKMTPEEVAAISDDPDTFGDAMMEKKQKKAGN